VADIRVFESNAAAFEYACEHLDVSLQDGRAVLAIVLSVQGRMCSVKIANKKDKSIPGGSINELLALPDPADICFSTMMADKVPNLVVGDLVMYTTMPELAALGKTTTVGTIISRVNPQHSSKTGWQVRPDESKVAPVQPTDVAGA
jgi:hypothetical protein